MDNLCNNDATVKSYIKILYKSEPDSPTIKIITDSMDKYKKNRDIPDKIIKQITDKFISDISNANIKINERCTDFYKDDAFSDLFKDSPKYYSQTSTFHIINNYIMDSISGRLTSTTS